MRPSRALRHIKPPQTGGLKIIGIFELVNPGAFLHLGQLQLTLTKFHVIPWPHGIQVWACSDYPGSGTGQPETLLLNWFRLASLNPCICFTLFLSLEARKRHMLTISSYSLCLLSGLMCLLTSPQSEVYSFLDLWVSESIFLFQLQSFHDILIPAFLKNIKKKKEPRHFQTAGHVTSSSSSSAGKIPRAADEM